MGDWAFTEMQPESETELQVKNKKDIFLFLIAAQRYTVWKK